MNICRNLDLFAGGALSTEDADAFRAHLPECENCQRQLHELMQMESAAQLYGGDARPEPRQVPSRVRWLAPVAAAVAAAAAAVLAVVSIRPPGRDPSSLAVASAHRVSLLGQVAAERGSGDPAGESAAPPIYLPNSVVQILVEPLDASLRLPAGVRLFISGPDDRLSPVPEGALSRSEDGGFMFSMSAAALFGERAGRWTIYVAVASSTEDASLLGPHLRMKAMPIEYRIEAVK
jgi:hypothetical protein